MPKRVLVCIPKCEKSSGFDEVYEIDNLINIGTISKDPKKYLKDLISIIPMIKSMKVDEDEAKEFLEKVVNKKFIELLLSNEDKELHICIKNRGIQGTFAGMLLSILKDVGKGMVVIEEKC